MPSQLWRRLDVALLQADPDAEAAVLMRLLVSQALDALPLPGAGHTLDRWRALARVGQHDLSLAKLYEGHTDALAILAELHAARPSQPAADAWANAGIWAVWAAESPEGRSSVDVGEDHLASLEGSKCWCSGASDVDQALLTAWLPDGRGPQLVRLRVAQPGVVMRHAAWKARGMDGARSPDIDFNGAEAHCVGEPSDYVNRPGFSQGGAGVAACWYGGAVAVARVLHKLAADAAPNGYSPLRLAALGRVAQSLGACAAVLREAAGWIDEHPRSDASTVALRARLSAETCARQVLDEVSRAVGPAPFCRDAGFARFAVDLPIFIRQCQGDRDFASLGQREIETQSPWAL
ncbi:MAG: acyl-CoA dehydrogenase [Pseudomonadota bacterium]|nr:acyl-CoA dehydrogenase [Pseudomonadota bacterium]